MKDKSSWRGIPLSERLISQCTDQFRVTFQNNSWIFLELSADTRVILLWHVVVNTLLLLLRRLSELV